MGEGGEEEEGSAHHSVMHSSLGSCGYSSSPGEHCSTFLHKCAKTL